MIPRKVHLMQTVCFMIFPYFTGIAEKKRGYFAFGGEFFILLLPAILWILWINVKDTTEILKNEDIPEEKEISRTKESFGISKRRKRTLRQKISATKKLIFKKALGRRTNA